MTTTTRRGRALGSLAALALLATTVAGCSSGSNTDSTGSGGSGGSTGAPAPAAKVRGAEGQVASPEQQSAGGTTDSLSAAFDAAGSAPGGQDAPSAKSVISSGNVALRSRDVAQARFDVQKVVDRYRGEVSQESTETDKEGEINRSRLVLRIPSASFAEAMTALEDAADLISSDTNLDDVTTEVIDVQVRLRVQKRSIARISQLLDRAQSIRDIVNIEGQLSRRQAQLGSLERRQAYLADQTAMSTVTVSLERTPEKKAPVAKAKDSTGFVAGLKAGWEGLSTVAVGIATVVGAVLPFLVVLLVLLLPGWPLTRRLLRRRTPTVASPSS